MPAVVPGTAPLIDRDDALTGIIEACERAFADGIPRVTLVLGDAGTGKSRLLQEAIGRLVDSNGALVLSGFAMPGEGHPAYFALGRAIRRLGAVQGIEQAVQPSTLPLLSTIELWQPIGHVELPPMEPAEGRVRLFEALSDVLAAATRTRPIIVALDDMQWASSADWDAIAHVARAVEGPLAFIVAARPEVEDAGSPAASALRELTRNRILTRARLHPLSDHAASVLTAALLGAPASISLLALLQEATRGNPFLLEELCSRLASEDCLVLSAGEWTFDPSSAVVPDAATFALQARFADLPPATKALVECAAIAGRAGLINDLAAMSDVGTEAVPGLLQSARSLGVIEIPGDGSWRFPHDIVREAVLRGVESPAAIHRRVARALAANPDAPVRATAEHWASAGEHVEAARVALAASAAAARLFAPQEALELARLAVVQASSAPQPATGALLAEAVLAVAEASLESTELQSAEDAYARLETLAANLGDSLLSGRARVGLGLVARRRERPDDAILHLRAGIHALAGVAGAESDMVRARITLATIYGLTQANYALADIEAGLALGIAQGLGNVTLEAEALLAIANCRVRAVGPTAARNDLEAALQHALSARQLSVAAEAAASLSNNYYWTGELRKARHFGEIRLDVATQAHDSFGLRHGRSWLALLAASAGSFSEALSLLQADEAWLQRLESPEPFAFATIVASLAHFRAGETAKAYEEASSAISRLEPLGDGTLLWYAGLLAAICVAAGRPDEAVAIASVQAARLSAVEDSALPARSARCALGLVYARLGMAAAGADCETRLRPFADDFHWWPVRLTLAELALLRGDSATALADIDVALTLTRREGQVPDTAWLLDLRARALGTGSPEGRTASQEARSIASRNAVALPRHDRGGPTTPPANLTPRELEVLRLVADGLSNHDIANQLVLSERTVINHVSHIFDKLDVDSRSAAAAWAIRSGIA